MNRNRNQKTLQLSIHVLSWILVFVLPFLLFSRNNEIQLDLRLLHHGVIFLTMLSVFYLNYFVLTERLLFRKKIPEFLLVNVVLIVLIGVGVHFWKEALPLWPDRPNVRPEPVRPVWVLIFRDILPLVLTAGLSIALKATSKWYRLVSQHQEEEQRRVQAELQNLRQQINPHFLFNTLNNIYALIAVSPDKAQTAVHDLSKLLRYALYDNGEKVELNREIEFIVRYVELMRIRLNEEVEVRLDVESVTDSSLEVAPMLFITLVENAFKHGISPGRPSLIEIAIQMLDKKRMVCRISNSYFPKDTTDRSGSGIGLENLRRRLELLYPNNHSFRCEVRDDVFFTELVLKL